MLLLHPKTRIHMVRELAMERNRIRHPIPPDIRDRLLARFWKKAIRLCAQTLSDRQRALLLRLDVGDTADDARLAVGDDAVEFEAAEGGNRGMGEVVVDEYEIHV